MTIQSVAAAPRAPAAQSSLVRRLAAAFAERRRRSRAEAELRAMSDRELRDIGLDRASIRAAVDGQL